MSAATATAFSPTASLSIEPVNSGAKTTFSGRGERTRDACFHTRIRRLYGLGEHVGDIAVAADQIFVKVPARHILWSDIGRPFVERMRIRSRTMALAAIGKVTLY
jgi:hypothetical protein